MYHRAYLEAVSIFIVTYFTLVYGIGYSVLPMFLVDLFDEPIGIFAAYMVVYVTSLWSKVLGLSLLILVVSVHVQLLPHLFSREIISP